MVDFAHHGVPFLRDGPFITGGSGSAPTSGLSITDPAAQDNRIVQRLFGTTAGPVTMAGTYQGGAPAAIEGQILKTSDDSVIVDWTNISATIGGGSWSGSLSTPASNFSMYYKSRVAANHALSATSTNHVFVGDITLTGGQSNMGGMWGASNSPPSASAGTKTFDGAIWSTPPAANGIRSYLNGITAATGFAAGAVDASHTGVTIQALLPGNPSGYFAGTQTVVSAMGGDFAWVIFDHGEGNVGNESGYVADRVTLHTAYAGLAGRTLAHCPLFFSTLGNAGVGVSGTQAQWDSMQGLLLNSGNPAVYEYYSHTNVDAVRFLLIQGLGGTAGIPSSVLTISSITGGAGAFAVGGQVQGGTLPNDVTIASFSTGTGGTGTYNLSQTVTVANGTTITYLDPYHYDGTSQGRQGSRFYTAISTWLGATAQYPNWHIASAATVDATHTSVVVAESIGSDFGPASGITGFEVSGNNGSTWIAATGAYVDATHLTLTHGSIATDSNRKLRYLYGYCLGIVQTTIVKENTSGLNIPLDQTGGIISPTPLSVLPVPTFQQYARASGNDIKTATGITLGTATAGTKEVIIAVFYTSVTQSGIVVTPNSGSPPTVATRLYYGAGGGNPYGQPPYMGIGWYQCTVPGAATAFDLEIDYAANPFANGECAIWTAPTADFNSTTPVDVVASSNTPADTTLTDTIATSSGGFVLLIACASTFPSDQASDISLAGSTLTYSVRAQPSISVANIIGDVSSVPTNAASSIVVTGTLPAPCLIGAISYR